MTCAQVTELLGPYTDEDLPTEMLRRVERHLMLCPTCANEAQTLKLSKNLARTGLGETVISDSFRARVLSRLMDDNPHLSPSEPEPATDPLQYLLPLKI